jgi:hypothetical protein
VVLLSGASSVPQPWHEATFTERAQRSLFFGVDNDRLARLATDDERDDTVVTRGRARHDALPAVDGAYGLMHSFLRRRRVVPPDGILAAGYDNYARRVASAISLGAKRGWRPPIREQNEF